MKRALIDRILAEELAHIPRRSDVPTAPLEQSVFRAAYNARRRFDLRNDPGTPRRVSLERSLALLERSGAATPAYDADFFSGAPTRMTPLPGRSTSPVGAMTRPCPTDALRVRLA